MSDRIGRCVKNEVYCFLTSKASTRLNLCFLGWPKISGYFRDKLDSTLWEQVGLEIVIRVRRMKWNFRRLG